MNTWAYHTRNINTSLLQCEYATNWANQPACILLITLLYYNNRLTNYKYIYSNITLIIIICKYSALLK